ncbi:hypothetical protein AMIS_20650 [Actinoplanes missouriensis 431]|uniref:Uncharacterized protein n=1 Tax=Actinoplanes missouriensis (strain ATCC 14538 / DSM 43046 / CBS 188.64 / JCM 3121 / NBRC 102363 / NCIMB 12654 / NRRL B-3342 / UNCC 431) TaxID=512565 RepID=I0H2P8_ACTM4|nr:hypothetical protein [Actinoplanes missouriensis]BAL87285.1 hypothetical protein AMIS_20650 [Actinoplanes missouriensis 431]
MDATQIVTAVIGVLGGIGGLGALVGSVFQRRKIRAEAADVLTDTALTLVEPLQERVKEVTKEAKEAREEARQAREEMADLRTSLAELMGLMRRWRAAVLSPHVSRETLMEMVRTDEVGSSNGRANAE